MTYGVGLEDCWPDTEKPSKHCWPEIIASTLGRKCINKSVPGSSNKRIWYSISKFKFRSDDLVLILWTYPDRTAVIRTPFNITNLLPSQVGNSYGEVEIMARSYYENLHAFYDSDVASKLYIRDATRKIKDLGLEFYQMIAEPRDKFLFENIEHISLFMSNYERNYNKALDDNHAGPDGHKAFARDFLKYINVDTDLVAPKPLSFFEKIKKRCR